MRDRPIELDVDNKLVYSAHDYPNSIYEQSWFKDPDFPANLPEKFDQMWGYIYREGIAPVYIGEFGTKLQDPKDAPWFEAITAYLSGDFDNDGVSDISGTDLGISWTFWSWNPNSTDTGGILADDWRTVNENKMAYLEPIQFDFETDVSGGDGGTGAVETYARFTVTLSEPADGDVVVQYHTLEGTAGDGDFTAASGTLVFAAGEQSKVVSIAITPDRLAEGDEQFSLVLTDASGAVIGGATGTATIVNDDAAVPPPNPDPDPTPDPEPEPNGDLDALFALVDSWGSGFNGKIVIQNDGAAVSGWELEIDMPYEIADIWNAEIVSRDADGYTIRNADWNGSIASGGEISFGFVGVGQGNAGDIDLFI
ncbi:MAG: hypothetical protein B7Z45_03495 [Azorhizobium sp. 12-66-6]|nr:MAG: hypothetical protein B7Z45_03495 [Azorhizobium sp. 12-66-6]